MQPAWTLWFFLPKFIEVFLSIVTIYTGHKRTIALRNSTHHDNTINKGERRLDAHHTVSGGSKASSCIHTTPCSWGIISLEPRPHGKSTGQRQWNIGCGCPLSTFFCYLLLLIVPSEIGSLSLTDPIRCVLIEVCADTEAATDAVERLFNISKKIHGKQ